MERRVTDDGGITIETRAGGTRTLIGYAAVFYREGDQSTEYRLGRNKVERIAPTAFDRVLGDDADVVALFNHKSDFVLGRRSAGTLRLTKDGRGLRYEIDMPDTSIAHDIAASVSRKDIRGSSFGFATGPGGDRWGRESRTEVRTLVDLHLVTDVGPVTFPAYDGTSAGMRAIDDAAEAMASYNQWRKAEVERRWQELQQSLDTAKV